MTTNVETAKIEQIIKQGESVKVYLRNGICLRGQITQQDDKVLVLQMTAPKDGAPIPGDENIIYKAAISTIKRSANAA